MKKTSLLVASALLLVGLAGCGSNPTPTPQSVVFTEEQLGLLMGDFYAEGSALTIGTTGATLVSGEEEIELKNVLLTGTGFDTKITYTCSEGQITVSWSKDDVKQVLVTLGEDSVTFQPSLESVKGWYTGDGYSGSGYYTYITTNDFSDEYGLFEGAVAYDTSIHEDSFGIESGYIEVEEEVKLYYGFYFLDDLSAPFESYYVEKDEDTGKIDLMYLDWAGFVSFESAVTPFDYEYFDSDTQDLFESLSFWGTDEEEKTVYVGWADVPSSYVEGFDEQGQFITVDDMLIRGTKYGITVEKDGEIKEMPLNKYGLFSSMEDIEYVNGANKVKYYLDWDSFDYWLEVDGEKCDSFEYDVYNHQLMMKGTLNDDVYYVDYYADGVAYVEKNGEASLYLNVSKFASTYARDYFDNHSNVLHVGEDLTTTYLSQTFTGSLSYDEVYGVILILSNGASIVCVDETTGIYAMTQGDKATFIYDKNLVSSFFNIDYANQRYHLEIVDNDKYENKLLIYKENTYYFDCFTYLNIGDTYYPALVAAKGETKLVVALTSSCVVLYQIEKDNSLTLISSFIPANLLMKATGTYKYDGPNGIETIKLSNKCVLTVDTATSETTFEPVVYEYMPEVDEYGNVILSFEYQTDQGIFQVPVVFDLEGHASIFTINYTEVTILNNQGAYTNGTDIVGLANNVLTFNGENVEITHITNNMIVANVDDDGNIIEVAFIFAPGESVEITGYDTHSIILEKSDVSLTSFTGEYINVSESGTDIIVDENGNISWRNTGSMFPPIPLNVDIDYVLIEGKVAIQFEYAGYLYTMQLVEGVPTVTAESTVPPPPPLPF